MRGVIATKGCDDLKTYIKMKLKGDLPRLDPEWYRDRAWVLWTHTVDQRTTGWLNDQFHLRFREILCHGQVRQWLACPVYVLMPDHIHLLWIGVCKNSDQLLATRFLRGELNRLLLPKKLQKQAHDHVLREKERQRDAFLSTWQYVVENRFNECLERISISGKFDSRLYRAGSA